LAPTLLLILSSLSCARVLRALHSFPTRRSSDLAGRVVLAAFSHRRLKRVRRLLPEVATSASPLEIAALRLGRVPLAARNGAVARSEEHTSELQSRFDLVCRLLLEKKKGKGEGVR